MFTIESTIKKITSLVIKKKKTTQTKIQKTEKWFALLNRPRTVLTKTLLLRKDKEKRWTRSKRQREET